MHPAQCCTAVKTLAKRRDLPYLPFSEGGSIRSGRLLVGSQQRAAGKR